MTPLHYASLKGLLHIAQYLLQNGADINALNLRILNDLMVKLHFKLPSKMDNKYLKSI